MPGSFCSCEYSGSPWLNFTFRESLCTFHSPGGGTDLDVDELGFPTIHSNGDHVLGLAYEISDLETDISIQCLRRGGSQHSPKNNDGAEQWESSPGPMLPPDPSSPFGLGYDSSPMSSHKNVTTRGPRLVCHGGQSQVKALFNDWKDPSAFIFPTTPLINPRHPHSPTSKLQTRNIPSTWINMGASSSTPAGSAALDERFRAISEKIAANDRDVCALTTQTAIEQTSNLDKADETNRLPFRGALGPLSRRRAMLSGPTILDSNEMAHASSHDAVNNGHRDAAAVKGKTSRNGGVPIPPKTPYCRAPIAAVSRTALDNSLKRRGSSIEGPPESKKLKLDRTLSHVPCVGESGVEQKYMATEPASIRRAQSLRSELSACSGANEPTDSVFCPSPLSPTRSGADKDYPPTVPSTPLPTSADYARSKANPLARTIPAYHRRSIPRIPSVPIIEPPQDPIPTVVRCSEDQAIDRLKALLLREHSERERDGLNAFDEQRTGQLKMACRTDSAFLRRESASTSDSSDNRGDLEDESVCTGNEYPEKQELASSVKVNMLSGLHRLASREIWSKTFGITNDFRKEITEWILKTLPQEPVEPVPCEQSSGQRYRTGIDLYDQLTSSGAFQTRFHAAQLFHRYFLLPNKVKFWRETRKHEQESCEPHDHASWKDGVWDLAVACMALGVKLHRDCLPPLGPVYAAEFLDLAPHSMTHEAFELAQRDITYTFQFLLGTCTPQDVLDELWNALPTLRQATVPIRDGWAVVQSVIWDKLFESLLEPDMLQFPVTLLTAAALVDGLHFALARYYRTEAEGVVCACKASAIPLVPECTQDDIEPTSSQIHQFEATELVDAVILDVRDVLHFSAMELDECRKWLSCVGQVPL